MKYPGIVIRDEGQDGDVVVDRDRLVPTTEARGIGKFKEGAAFEARNSGPLKGLGLYLDEEYDHVVVLDEGDL